MAAHRLEVLLQDLQGAQAPTVGELERAAKAGVAGDLPGLGHGVGQAQAAPGRGDAVGQDLEHQGGHAELEPGHRVEAVGVSGHQVEAPPALGVGVGLVAGVDQGTVHRGSQAHDLLEVVGPLTDLEGGVLGDGASADPAGAHQERADHEQGYESLGEVVEVNRARHEVVLVGAVGGALAVDVVLEQAGRHAATAQQLGSPGHQEVPGPVGQGGLRGPGALGGGVLGVSVVHVETPATGQAGGGAALPGLLLGGQARHDGGAQAPGDGPLDGGGSRDVGEHGGIDR